MISSTKVAAGVIQVACQLGERYGIPRTELLYVAALEPEELSDPDARVPSNALLEMVLYMIERTGDRSIGIRFAEAMDLRTQGFWGYAFISSLSMRQAAELMMRFQRLRHSGQISYWVEGEWVIFDAQLDAPAGMEAIAGDAFLATFCFLRQRWLPEARGEMRAWLMYAEEPHHAELRRLVGGPIVFDAPFNRWQFPVQELDVPSRGADPHLARLVEHQLEKRLLQMGSEQIRDLAEQVRKQVAIRLEQDASIERIARDLRLSARTLRRRLDALGVSFQRLLDEVRHARAVEYLTRTNDAIERVAERLGYGDPSNFRRAFRRWTGQPPARFRAGQRSRAPAAPTPHRAPRQGSGS
jgi:AraC-like DNA-binding protein